MADIYAILRTLHVIAAALWIGEIMVINVIIIPVLSKYEGSLKKQVITTIFPRLFKLASVLAATVVISGLIMVYFVTNGNFGMLLYGKWGLSILIGGLLGIMLTIFHFFFENKLAKKIVRGNQGDEEKLAEVHLRMKIVPKIGLTILLVIFLLMINAAHGVI